MSDQTIKIRPMDPRDPDIAVSQNVSHHVEITNDRGDVFKVELDNDCHRLQVRINEGTVILVPKSSNWIEVIPLDWTES